MQEGARASSCSMQNFTYSLGFQHDSHLKLSWGLLNPESILFNFSRAFSARNVRGNWIQPLLTQYFSSSSNKNSTRTLALSWQHTSAYFKICHCWLRFERLLGETLLLTFCYCIPSLILLVVLGFYLLFTTIPLVEFSERRGDKCLC